MSNIRDGSEVLDGGYAPMDPDDIRKAQRTIADRFAHQPAVVVELLDMLGIREPVTP